MAVISISKIQVRRGLQENLPQLASGELGWAIDTQRLFVGNGTLSEGAPLTGNTEILTAGTELQPLSIAYTFRGSASGYTSQTGPSANEPVRRTVSEKLDDVISLKDFITQDDIDSNDYTAAIQRAIDQIYPALFFTNFATRRSIYIPGGNYPISAPIIIPPYAKIAGDGQDSTRIIQTNPAADAVIILSDSRRQIGEDIGKDNAVLSIHNTIANMTLENQTDNDIVIANSSRELLFDNVKFRGGLLEPASTSNFKAGVRILADAGQSNDIVFNHCYFTQITQGVFAAGDVVNLSISESAFFNLYQGLVTTEANSDSPQAIKVSMSTFDAVAQEAIYSGEFSSVISAFNYYSNKVGYGDGSVVITGNVSSPVLAFETTNNSSIGDIFFRSTSDIAQQPLIKILSEFAVPANQTVNTTFGSLQTTPGRAELLLDNTGGSTNLVLSNSPSNIIDYSIIRGDKIRNGTIKITQSDSDVVFEDDYTETDDVGVILSFTGTGLSTVMNYFVESDNSTDAVIKYNVRSFI